MPDGGLFRAARFRDVHLYGAFAHSVFDGRVPYRDFFMEYPPGALVAFLETLTDDRVVFQRAPFDHPQLFVPNGHPGNSNSTTDANGDGLADDVLVEIPAIGAEGGNPLPGFLEGIFGPTP